MGKWRHCARVHPIRTCTMYVPELFRLQASSSQEARQCQADISPEDQELTGLISQITQSTLTIFRHKETVKAWPNYVQRTSMLNEPIRPKRTEEGEAREGHWPLTDGILCHMLPRFLAAVPVLPAEHLRKDLQIVRPG